MIKNRISDDREYANWVSEYQSLLVSRYLAAYLRLTDRFMRLLVTTALFVLTHVLVAQQPAATPPPYSPAFEANGLLFVSGQIGRSNGKLVTDSFEAEAEQVMKNVGQILSDNKLSFSDVVNVTIYLKDMKRYDETNAVYRRYFTATRLPARVCVAVADLPAGASIEISAVALLRKL